MSPKEEPRLIRPWRKPLLVVVCTPVVFVVIIALLALFGNLSDDPGDKGYFFWGALILYPLTFLVMGYYGIVALVRYLRAGGQPVPATNDFRANQCFSEPRSDRPEPEAPHVGPLNCPACGAALVQMGAGDSMMEVCRHGCQGMWFNNYVLRPALARLSPDDLDADDGDPPPHVDVSQKRGCPRCRGIFMLKRWYSPTCHIEIDECPSCGGIWLDRGEYRLIHAALAREGADTRDGSMNPEAAVLKAQVEAGLAKERNSAHTRRTLAKIIGKKHRFRGI